MRPVETLHIFVCNNTFSKWKNNKCQYFLPSRFEDGRISMSFVQPQSAATKAVPNGQCIETLPAGAICINFFSSVKSAKLVQTKQKMNHYTFIFFYRCICFMISWCTSIIIFQKQIERIVKRIFYYWFIVVSINWNVKLEEHWYRFAFAKKIL